MADKAGKAEKLYSEWFSAEAQYSEALAAFGGSTPPTKVKKESALALAKARSAADVARDKYFKHALKSS